MSRRAAVPDQRVEIQILRRGDVPFKNSLNLLQRIRLSSGVFDTTQSAGTMRW